jgi:hypothetical protein
VTEKSQAVDFFSAGGADILSRANYFEAMLRPQNIYGLEYEAKLKLKQKLSL